MASQITNFKIVYSTVYSGADQRKYQSSASLALVRGIHRWPLNSPHKGPVTRKMFPFDYVIMKLTLHTLNSFEETQKRACIFYHFTKIGGAGSLHSSSHNAGGPFILCSQYHGCGWIICLMTQETGASPKVVILFPKEYNNQQQSDRKFCNVILLVATRESMGLSGWQSQKAVALP